MMPKEKLYNRLILSYFALSAFIFLSSVTVKAQLISDQRKTNWGIAGLSIEQNKSNEMQTLSMASADMVTYNFVTDFGGDNSGKKDNASLLVEALHQVATPAVIHFPSGIYLFKKHIEVPSGIIIRGTSPNTTHFLFDLSGRNQSLFIIKGKGNTSGRSIKVTDPHSRGDNVVEVEDGEFFAAGDNIELDQENDPKMYFTGYHNKEWARRSVGQMMKVAYVKGNKVYLDRSLTLNYDTKFDLRIAKVEMTKNVGFEAFAIERLDNGLGRNFLFEYAANSWISCVRSSMATRYHVEIRKSRNCLIKGSYFHDTQFHCGGGAGYGVMLRQHATECLIYNNIFVKLRHAMIVKEGANRNIISYNYSKDVKVSDGHVADKRCYNIRFVDSSPDISIHGHYSYMNLFEHNIVQAIHSADNWGSTGPGTTFFRNKVESAYGIKISMASEGQNLLGNVINGRVGIDSSVVDVLRIQNKEYNKIDASPHVFLPPSLYLDSKPDFYGSMAWPSVNPDKPLKLSTNPAKERVMNHKVFDENCCSGVPGLNSSVVYKDDFVIFYEPGQIFIEHLPEEKFNLTLLDIQGKMIKYVSDFNTADPMELETNLSNGLYILNLQNQERSVQIKFLVN